MMSQLEIIVWLIAGLGWMLDWATTVWPDNEFPEKNPFVVKHFGRHPDPFRFGLAKSIGLIIGVGLYFTLGAILAIYEPLPTFFYGFKLQLIVPIAFGVAGWHGSLNNLRLIISS